MFGFAFDPASNIVEATERDQHGIGTEGGRRAAPLLDNLLKQYAGTHFDYDERGNLTRRTHNGESTQFEWNALGRMTGAVNRHMRATYAYDALGRRIAKYTEAQVTPLPMAGSGWRDAERARLAHEHGYGLTLYGWDGDRLAYETVKARREIVHYIYEPDSFTPLARMSVPMDQAEAEQGTAPSLAYYHCDQIGTPQELTDEAGEMAWSARYQAWGAAQEVISEAARKAGITNPLRFAGQYFDRETGLHYNRHRYYDPASGRFVSKDPIGLAGGINVFQYARNPINWVDPLGLERIKNAIDGARREDEFNAQMRAKHPSAAVQCQCYLRNAQGQSVKDPVTGERRRVDTAVIEDGLAQTYEVTSMTADKDLQLAKEGRILQNGGTYIRDRFSGDLVPVNGVSDLVKLP